LKRLLNQIDCLFSLAAERPQAEQVHSRSCCQFTPTTHSSGDWSSQLQQVGVARFCGCPVADACRVAAKSAALAGAGFSLDQPAGAPADQAQHASEASLEPDIDRITTG